MFISILFVLNIVHHVALGQYDLNSVFPGTRMSVNDDLFVSASNAFANFAVVMHPFRNASDGGPVRCNMRYNTTDRFVHSVSVAGISKNSTNAEQFVFVFAAERMSTKTPFVCVGIMIKATCISQVICTDLSPAGVRQEYFLISVDTNGTFAYGFSSTFAFKLDIYNNRFVLNLTTENIWPRQGFIPHAMDVADTWGVVAGYGYTDPLKKIYAALGCLIDLSTLLSMNCTALTSETTFLIPSNVDSYNELYELSVAIRKGRVLVGVHRLSSIVILQNQGKTLNVTRVYTLSYGDAIPFGRVIDWADDTTVAVLVEDPYESTWSKSQIYFYDEKSITVTTPVVVFPNNQQIIGSRLAHPAFARFGITPQGNMAILTDKADILIIPKAAAGYVSRWIDTTEKVFVFYYEPRFCIGGTYKNRSSLGSCQICPPGTRNPGNLSTEVLQCLPCPNNISTASCPSASLIDVDLSTVPTYSQAVAYPETADTANVEDILIKNVFQLDGKPRCLVVSPLLWTLVVIGVCLLVILTMVFIKKCGCKKCNGCPQRTKQIFKHTDIIGEGEMWAGGLATLAIIVLVSFSYWFSVSFIRRYPIENVLEPATFSCDETIINSQFSTGLVLLDIPKSEDSQLIFDLLDQQVFHLTIELINTGFSCNSITMQENLSGSKHVTLPVDCTQMASTATTSVTFPLPGHKTSVQMNMTGPNWVGALRLCIRGHSQQEGSTTLRQLDFCEFYETPNVSIGRLTEIPIVFIKDINMTQALDPASPATYSGLWMPTFTKVSLSDEAYYIEFGNYLRYTSSSTVLQISLDERPFYIKNIQQPIVRAPELVFQGLLFTSLCIELFAFSFLLINLLVLPLIRLIIFLAKKIYHRIRKTDHRSSSIDSNPSNFNDSTHRSEATQVTPALSHAFVSIGHEQKYSYPEIGASTIELVSRL